MNAQERQLDAAMLRLLTGHFVSQAVYCAAELELADKLADGPKSAPELAELAGCSPAHLQRLLAALASIGVFGSRNGRYHLTPLGERIRRDRPDSLWPVASWFGSEMYGALGSLLATVRSGRPAGAGPAGLPTWQYLEQNPSRSAVFDAMVDAACRAETEALASAYDFSDAGTIVDVGGGTGAALAAILGRHPHARGVLFDLPQVVARASADPRFAPLRERCSFEAGDFFAELPNRGDLYLLRHVLHDWNDGDCLRILRSCRASLPRSARLLVVESLVDEGNAGGAAKWSDLGVMTLFGGEERTRAAYDRLLADAGYRVTSATPVVADVALLECRAGASV